MIRPAQYDQKKRMSAQLPPLKALRAFEALGRTGSVRGAGKELLVSYTAISRHIRHLETHLGVRLVVKSGRGLALTEEGRQFHAKVAQAFGIITKATSVLKPRAKAEVRIWCAPGVANRRLLSWLPDLEERLPGAEVLLQPTHARPDLVKGEADAEISFAISPEPRPGIRSEVIIEPRVFPVSSQVFKNQHPELKSIEDLATAALIHEESTEQWAHWLELAGLENVPPLRGACLWHAHLAIEAARLGQGIALANDVLISPDLDSGAVTELFTTKIYLGAYYFNAPENAWNTTTVATLREWVYRIFNARLNGA